MGEIIWFQEMNWAVVGIFGVIVLSVINDRLAASSSNKKTKRQRKVTNTNKRASSSKQNVIKEGSGRVQRSSMTCRPDEVILTRHLSELNGAEFERLLALYFRGQGYTVNEVGVGGRDGGVDLVIRDQRGEKTAVQAKCYADHNKVKVQIVRELVAAKRNHDCILSLLITTSDLTSDAKKEAGRFKVEYWHGGIIEQKLKAWGQWKPTNRRPKPAAK
ncbi:restriction endonuclease [Paenibacillus sp. 79R4]|uniref:restriction endonuclease n=1 Tax=Paenibacillus sp. 79R4 TaxID=2212847 RepID=UPI002117565F|nr:restriction endonuclease [Paenibacillus sp. 79R4]